MKSVGRRFVAPTILSLAAVAAVAARPQLQKARMYMSGSVIPEGSRTLASAGRAPLWLSVEGRRWVTRDRQEDAAAYYALVIPPRGSVRADDSTSTSDGFTHADTLKWFTERDVGGGSRVVTHHSLTVSYNAVKGEVSVGPDAYALSRGNLFVIRLDGEGRTHVTQMEAGFSDVDGFDRAREVVRRAMPDEEAVREP
jgi:hypothetical protein